MGVLRPGRSVVPWVIGTLLLAVGVGTWLCTRMAASSEVTVETLLRGMQHNLDQIETLEATVSVSSADRKHSGANARPPARWRVAMGSTGCREESMPAGAEDGLPVEIRAFDGASAYTWDLASNTGGIAHDLTQTVTPDFVLSLFSLADRFFPRVPSASGAIRAAQGLRLVGIEPVGGVDCYRLEGRLPSGAELTWWVAPDRGFQVKRHDWTYLAPSNTEGVVRTRWSEVVEEFTQFEDGTWLPTKRTAAATWVHADGTESFGASQGFEVVNLTINEPVDEDLFRPQFFLSTKVVDEGARFEQPIPGEFGVQKG